MDGNGMDIIFIFIIYIYNWELCPSHFLKWPKMDQKRKNPFKNGKFSKKNEILKKMKILKKNQIMKKFWKKRKILKKIKNFEKN